MHQLTHLPVSHRFGRNCKDGKQLRHNLPQQLCKVVCEGDLSVNVQTFEEGVNAFKEVDNLVVARHNIPDDLKVGSQTDV